MHQPANSEHKRYCLTLTVVEPQQRDKFRALSRPETFFEIRPNREPGQRGAYSVMLSDEEYERARQDAEDPDVNLIHVEPDVPVYPCSVPNAEALQFMSMQNLAGNGLDGGGVKVAVIDTGVSSAVAGMFGSRLIAQRGYTAYEDGSVGETGAIDDTAEHGTAIAGLATPPRSSLIMGKYAQPYASTISALIYWAVDDNGADVINMSLGLGADVQSVLRDALGHAASNDTLLFASAGNGGLDNTGQGANVVLYPGSDRDVQAITNYDWQTGDIAFTSNYGQGIFAAADGSHISVYNPNGSEGFWEDGGTSAASAMATRMAASLLTGKKSKGNVRDYMARTARKTDSPLLQGNGILQGQQAAQARTNDKPYKKHLDGRYEDKDGNPIDGTLVDGSGNPVAGNGSCSNSGTTVDASGNPTPTQPRAET